MYSTNPEYQYEDTNVDSEISTPKSQEFRIFLDKKARAGKKVTLVTGFVGHDMELQILAKELKNLCGVGGTAKDGEILLQGDFRDKVLEYLVRSGHRAKKAGG